MPHFELILFVVSATLCLLVAAQRARATRKQHAGSLESASPHKLRITQSGGKRRILLDGVEISNPDTITDPVLCKALARGEEAIAEVDRRGTTSLRHTRSFVVNGIKYQALSEISDPHLRKLAEEALKKS